MRLLNNVSVSCRIIPVKIHYDISPPQRLIITIIAA